MEQLASVAAFFEAFCPASLALPDDPTGLAVQNGSRPVKKILGALELNPRVLQKILDQEIDFLYLHHPPIWEPLTQLNSQDPWTCMLLTLYQQGVTVLAHHTNLDCACPGMAEAWIEGLELFGETRVLLPRTVNQEYTVVTFLPPQTLDLVRDGVFQAGAGTFGRYRDCSFSAPGTGTYTPQSGANPYQGKPGQPHTADEVRLEVSVSASELEQVLSALHHLHPYEEPVITVFPLHRFRPVATGLGRLITLTTGLDPSTLLQRARHLFSRECRLESPCGSTPTLLTRIALCPGSGSSLIPAVLTSGAQIYLTGDLSHHQGEKLLLHGLFSLHVPHSSGERYAFAQIFQKIRDQAREDRLSVEFLFEDECD